MTTEQQEIEHAFGHCRKTIHAFVWNKTREAMPNAASEIAVLYALALGMAAQSTSRIKWAEYLGQDGEFPAESAKKHERLMAAIVEIYGEKGEVKP